MSLIRFLDKWLTYRIGLRMLKRGWCPKCASSPPDLDCPVCFGNHQYSYRISEQDRAMWGLRWLAYKP